MSRATATSTLYRNADGSYTRLAYPEPVNYQLLGYRDVVPVPAFPVPALGHAAIRLGQRGLSHA